MKIADTSGQDIAVEQKPKGRQRLILAGALLVVMILIWLGVPSVQRWASSSVSVPKDRLRLAVVIRADLVRDVSVQGRVVAAISPSLFAPADGTITLLVGAGASVEEGEILATLNSPELNNQLQQEQSTPDSMRVELDRQKIETKQKALNN